VNLQGIGNTATARPAGGLEKVARMFSQQEALRTLALAEAMEENIVLHTMVLSPDETDDEMFQESIVPCLETNST
jgi:hypothetical protein